MIVNKARRMQAMIKGLLEYAATVEKPADRMPADAGAAVQRALQDLDVMIEASSAEITLDPLPAVAAAENQLVLVFSNLICNAIKYCPRGRKPHVHISAREQ